MLYLQLDNAADNKNRYLLAFCALLVHTNVFRKVKISFLMVGHTHEDVEQVFSRISVALGRKHILSRASLENTITTSYTPNIEVRRLQQTGKWNHWLTNTMQLTTKFRGIKNCRAFKCERNSAGNVMIWGRANMATRKIEHPNCWGNPIDLFTGHLIAVTVTGNE